MTRRLAFNYLMLFVILFTILELGAYAIIAVSRPLFSEPIRRTADIYREQTDYVRRWLRMDERGRDAVDPIVGWRYRAGFSNGRNSINSHGLRSLREYEATAPAGVLRVAAFGDSFVYGNEVVDANAWASIVEVLFDDIELLNYGVGGYGLDQALLRYRSEGDALSPEIVLIGFIADDIRRVTNVYQRFASTRSGVFTKPRFMLEANDELTLLPPPIRHTEDWVPILDDPGIVREWGEHDQWYEPLVYDNPLYDYSALVRLLSTIWIRLENRYLDPDRLFIGERFNESAEAYRLQMEILKEFAQDVRANGAFPIVLVLPSRGELTAHLNGEPAVYAPLLDDLTAAGITHWDASEAFPEVPIGPRVNEWFAPGGHYSPTGNRLVAAWLGPRLQALGDRP